MKILLLGASSVSGQSFASIVKKYEPKSELTCMARNDLEGIDTKSPAPGLLRQTLGQTLKEVNPSHIINFLGSFSNDFATDLLANVTIPQCLLEASVEIVPSASILLIGSAAEYGRIKNPDLPVLESAMLSPVSVYGLTKMMQSLLVPFYANRFSLNVKLARTFNILAPKLSHNLFVGRVFHQIEEIKTGRRSSIEVGNLNDERDYISVEAATRDYLRILLNGTSGETYNVCSGKAIKMLDLLKGILADAGLPNVHINQDETVARSAVPKIFGSRQKIDSLLPT